MMRAILVAVVAGCLAVSAVSQDEDPFLKGDALQAEIAKSCQDGCITFSREEAAEFERQLQAVLAAKQRDAFDSGVRHQRQACASLVSL